MTVRVYSDQAGTTAATANDNIGKVEDLSKFDSDGVSSTTGPYLSVDANGFGSADILAQGGDVVQTFTNAIADGSALVVGTSKCIFFSNVNVEAGGTLTIGPAGDMINTNGLNLIGKVVSVATTTKVLTTAEQNSIATFFAERGASSVVVNDETVYDVNSVEADVVLDFTGDSFYRNVPHYFKLGGTYSTFAEAFTGTSPKLTYSTAAGSNSTMSQGYGPELVANGTFDTDSGWTVGAGWTIDVDEGVATHSGTAGPLDYALTGMDTSKTYEVSIQITGSVSGNLAVQFLSGAYATLFNASPDFGTLRVYGSPLSTTPTLRLYGGTNATYNIDNISVREAPKIVWAPHNLIMNSEDFRASGPSSPWVHQNGASITENALTAPDGSSNGTQLDLSASTGSQIRHDHNLSSSLVADLIFKVWVRCANGTTEKVRLQSYNAVDGSQTSNDLTVSDTWTPVDLAFSKSSGAAASVYIKNATDGAARTIYIWGAHVYRSDLGGMAQVPGAATGFEYYVPTSGSAEYLPRVGHHVYNGTTWVNEGLLIESEARSNLVTYSEDFSQWPSENAPTTPNDTTAPDGTQSATKLEDNSAATNHKIQSPAATITSGSVTGSMFIKAGTTNFARLRLDGTSSQIRAWFNLATGEVGTVDSGGQGLIEDVGNGWFKCSVVEPGNTVSSSTVALQVFTQEADAQTTYSGSGSYIYVYGAQLEQGPTPSSYMPTNGGTYTRTAQSLEVPPAQFGWPEPEYIGPELVANNDFSLGDNGDWTSGGSDGSSNTFNSGVARLYGNAIAYQAIPTVAGKVYYAQWEVTDATTSGDFRIGTTHNGTDIYDQTPNGGVGSYSVAFVATSSTTYITLKTHYPVGDLSKYTDFDNISVREINPLAVSIQMDGRMTYADDVTDGELVRPYRWHIDNNNRIRSRLSVVSGSDTGNWLFQQTDAAANDEVATGSNTYTPGILTPFNIASRHGSTFINGAADGVALTADTTPTALPDLSNTNLQIAYDFMGTIGTFRQFAGDIGDTGLVTATKPSTEPTLSLTFDGSEGSFYNLSWSE